MLPTSTRASGSATVCCTASGPTPPSSDLLHLWFSSRDTGLLPGLTPRRFDPLPRPLSLHRVGPLDQPPHLGFRHRPLRLPAVTCPELEIEEQRPQRQYLGQRHPPGQRG